VRTGYLLAIGSVTVLLAVTLALELGSASIQASPSLVGPSGAERPEEPDSSLGVGLESNTGSEQILTREQQNAARGDGPHSDPVGEVQLDTAIARDSISLLIGQRDSLKDDLSTLQQAEVSLILELGAMETTDKIRAADLRDSDGNPMPNIVMFGDGPVQYKTFGPTEYPEIYGLFQGVRELDAEINSQRAVLELPGATDL